MKYKDGEKRGEPLGSGASNQPVGSISADSRDLASFGRAKAMKR